jgi:hypothetical protein
MATKGARLPSEHLEILKKSGILNPDITLDQIIKAAADLDEVLVGGGGGEVSVPTLVGPFYVYHALGKLTIDDGVV